MSGPEGASIQADTAQTETSGPPAQDPELEDLMEKALGYHEKALSENTCRAYRRGWEDFAQFCDKHGSHSCPRRSRPSFSSSPSGLEVFLPQR